MSSDYCKEMYNALCSFQDRCKSLHSVMMDSSKLFPQSKKVIRTNLRAACTELSKLQEVATCVLNQDEMLADCAMHVLHLGVMFYELSNDLKKAIWVRKSHLKMLVALISLCSKCTNEILSLSIVISMKNICKM